MLKEKTILITGATGAIGSSCAKALANLNANLILLSKDEKKLATLASELMQSSKKEPLLCPFNLETASTSDHHHLKQELNTYCQSLDALVHCAGTSLSLSSIEHLKNCHWEKIIQINLNARFHITQACLPLLKKSPSAYIFFVLSNLAINQGKAFYHALQIADKGNYALVEILNEELHQTSAKAYSLILPSVHSSYRETTHPFENHTDRLQNINLYDFWQKLFLNINHYQQTKVLDYHLINHLSILDTVC